MNHFKKLCTEFRTYLLLFFFLSNLLSIGAYIVFKEILAFELVIAVATSVAVALAVAAVLAALATGVVTVPIRALWQAIQHVSPGESTEPAPNLETLPYGKELVSNLVKHVYNMAGSRPLFPGDDAKPVTANFERYATQTAEPSPLAEEAAYSTASQSVADTPDDSAAADTQQPNQAAVPVAANAAKLTSDQVTELSLQATDALLETLPVPVFVLGKDRVVRAVNKLAAEYVGLPENEIVNKPMDDILHLHFSTESTVESWLGEAANRATDTAQWNRVTLHTHSDNTKRQFDMAGYYNKDNPDNNEIILALFDQNERYSNEDASTSYVALAVHELRTPLTVLRGYIEALEEELADTKNPELEEFMRKMSASAQTLTAFVSNILNVARVDEGQLSLNLHEENWNTLLSEICTDLELRARVRGKHLEFDIEENLPTVAVDKISIYEVVSNLIENAIKYSPTSDKIIIHAHKTSDGRVETVVQDFGIGVPTSAIKGLFTKFYRSHRSKNQVSGSGLGLYLVKAIVSAHGGNVWVQSKEGEGSSFGFSLQAYSQLSEEQKAGHNREITHQAHGWIKNHTLQRQ